MTSCIKTSLIGPRSGWRPIFPTPLCKHKDKSFHYFYFMSFVIENLVHSVSVRVENEKAHLSIIFINGERGNLIIFHSLLEQYLSNMVMNKRPCIYEIFLMRSSGLFIKKENNNF